MPSDKKKKNTEVVDNNKKGEYFVYIVILTSLLVMGNSITSQSFNVFGVSILYKVFLYPFTFFFANVITEKHGPRKTILAIIIAILVQVLVVVSLQNVPAADINADHLLASVAAFAVSQIVNMILYSKIVNSKSISFTRFMITYATVLLIDSFVYQALTFDGFNKEFFIIFSVSNIIMILLAILLSLADLCSPHDKKIKIKKA